MYFVFHLVFHLNNEIFFSFVFINPTLTLYLLILGNWYTLSSMQERKLMGIMQMQVCVCSYIYAHAILAYFLDVTKKYTHDKK
jgi:hypothetical protein